MRETENFSMYSDISMRTSALSSPNMRLCQCFTKLGLAYARGAEEQERADGAMHVLEPRSRPADRAGDGA